MKFELKPNEFINISFKEFCARLWPFGMWTVVWRHAIDGEFVDKAVPVIKVNAVRAFLGYKHGSFQKTIRVKKVGGFFDGIEYEPRTPGRRRKGKIR